MAPSSDPTHGTAVGGVLDTQHTNSTALGCSACGPMEGQHKIRLRQIPVILINQHPCLAILITSKEAAKPFAHYVII